MTRLNFGSIFVKGGLCLGVLLQHGREGAEILEQVGISQVTTSRVGQEGGESKEHGDGQQSRPVAGAKTVQSCNKQASGLFFRRETQKVDIKLNNFIIPKWGQ